MGFAAKNKYRAVVDKTFPCLRLQKRPTIWMRERRSERWSLRFKRVFEKFHDVRLLSINRVAAMLIMVSDV